MGKRDWRHVLSRRMSALVKAAERQGWTVDCTSNGHVRFRSPEGAVVIGSGIRSELDQHYARTVKRLTRLGAEL